MQRYLAPAYFAPPYFFATELTQTAQTFLGPPNDARIFASMESILRAAGIFSEVAFPGHIDHLRLPNTQSPLAVIAPLGWRETDDADANLVLRTVDYEITIATRPIDPRTGFEELTRLGAQTQNALDASNLMGQTLSGRTRLSVGTFDESSCHSEQRVSLRGAFAYRVNRGVGRAS